MKQRKSLVGRYQQKGITLSSVVFFGIIAALCLALVFKVTPVYNQYFEVKKTLSNIMSQGYSSEADIRTAFDKASRIGSGFAISASKLEIKRENGSFYVNAKWDRTVPLFANVSLLFNFDVQEKSK